MKTISSPFDKFAITKLPHHSLIAEWLALIWQKLQSSELLTQRGDFFEAEFLLDMAQVGETVSLRFSADPEQNPHCLTRLIDVQFGHHALMNLPYLCEQLRLDLSRNLELLLTGPVLGTAVLDAHIRDKVKAGDALHCRVSTRVSGAAFLQDYKESWGQTPSPFSSNWVNNMARIGYGMSPFQSPIYAHNGFHPPGNIPKAYREIDAREVSPLQRREAPVGEMCSDDSYRQEFDAYDFEALNQKFLELLVEKTPDHLKANWSKKAYEFKAVLFGGEISLCWKVFHLGNWRILLSAKENMADWLEATALESAVALVGKSWLEVGMPIQEWPTTDYVEWAKRSVQACDAKKIIRTPSLFNSGAAG